MDLIVRFKDLTGNFSNKDLLKFLYEIERWIWIWRLFGDFSWFKYWHSLSLCVTL